VTYLAYIGIGSNIGDRLKYCQQAVFRLSTASTTVTKVSSLYETDPVDYTEQDKFYNAVVAVETALNPLVLLQHCQQIERELGKKIEIPKGPRTVDLDILFMATATANGLRPLVVAGKEASSHLTIPHPSALERLFVLIPMAEIAPDFLPETSALFTPRPTDTSVRKVFDQEWAGSAATIVDPENWTANRPSTRMVKRRIQNGDKEESYERI